MRYEVMIEETLTRTVVIEADTPFDAAEAAEEMCNSGVIDLNASDFSGRLCQCVGIAEDTNTGEPIFVDHELTRLESEAKEAIKSFCQAEYQEDADFSDLTKIPLLYTDDEKEGFEYKVEVFANLPKRSISTYVNGVLVSCVKQKTLADFVDTLQFLDFDAYAEISKEEWAEYNRRQGLVGLPTERELWYYDDPNQECVTQVEYNPDSASRGQFFVRNIPYKLIFAAATLTSNVDDFMDYIGVHCGSACADITTSNFAQQAANLRQNEPDFITESHNDARLWLMGVVAKEGEVP